MNGTNFENLPQIWACFRVITETAKATTWISYTFLHMYSQVRVNYEKKTFNVLVWRVRVTTVAVEKQ
jgi:hypothetical protein